MAIFNTKVTYGKHQSTDPKDKLAYYKFSDKTVTFTNPSSSIIKVVFLLFFLIASISIFVNNKDITFSYFISYFSTCPSVSIPRNWMKGPVVSTTIKWVDIILNPISGLFQAIGLSPSLPVILNFLIWVLELLANTSIFIIWVLRFFFA